MSVLTKSADVSPPGRETEVSLACERPLDAPAVSALVESAFGPGRYAKVSERLREGNQMICDLSFCAFSGEQLIGTVRQWPIVVGAAPGVFLGPIAVDGDWRRHGVGGLLIDRCIAAAAAARQAYILLVGDLSLFGPHGFAPVGAGRVMMPSPVDPRRVLVCPLGDTDAHGVSGFARTPRPTS